MGPIASILTSLRHVFQLETRATRSEFWWTMLCLVLLLYAGIFVNFALFDYFDPKATPKDLISAGFVVFYVGLAGYATSVTIRRLHDVNASGWNSLWIFFPGGIGVFVIAFMCSQKGTAGFNRFGPDARQAEELKARILYDEADEFG